MMKKSADKGLLLDEKANGAGLLSGLIGYRLRRASAAFFLDFQQTLAGTDIRQVPFAILSVIGNHPGIKQGLVGRRLGIQRANMVALINELAARNLVERRTAAEDRRAVELTLTKDGVAMLELCKDRILQHEEAMLADLSGDERAMLTKLLAKIEARGARRRKVTESADTAPLVEAMR